MRSLLALVASLVVVPGAAGASFSVTVNTASPVTAPGITLSGDDQSTNFTMQYTVAYTGSGNSLGWNVTAAATTLTSGSSTLPAMKVTNVSSANCTGNGCVNPTNTVTWPVVLSTTAQKIFNAQAGTGKGSVVLTATYLVSYPANALAGNYSSTVTISGSTGP